MANSAEAKPEFGKIRSFFWPIYSDELKKFLPMAMMMFFILFNYSVLRSTKDAVVITAAGSSAVIPYLKFFFVLPASIIFVLCYAKLVNILSREKIFYFIILGFVSFFLVYSFVLYPARGFIHASPETIAALKTSYPSIQNLFPAIGYWSSSIFYVLAELWGSVMITLLFWQFANEITRTREAKRFYAMFGLVANLALIAVPLFGRSIKVLTTSLPAGVDKWGAELQYVAGFVALFGFILMLIYRWMNTRVLTDPKYYDAAEAKGQPKRKKPKLSVGESIAYIFSSKYLGFIAILVIAYGVSINLIELVWKDSMRTQFPDPRDYKATMDQILGATGFMTIILILMLKGIVAKFGWIKGAIVTPLMILVTGLFFFAFIIYQDGMGPVAEFLGTTTLMMAVLLGAAQNVLSKGTKYSLFDPTKEMTYIPLDQEAKVKGKAAVDVIGGRLGKAGGGLISMIVLGITAASSVLVIAPVLAVIVVVVIAIWVVAVKGLDTMYTGLRTAKKDIDAAKQKKA